MILRSVCIGLLEGALVLGILLHPAWATVNLVDGKGNFIGELVGTEDQDAGLDNIARWTVYNPTLGGLFYTSSYANGIMPPGPHIDYCPYFEETGSPDDCDVGKQPYLHPRYQGWIVVCGDRYFRSANEIVTLGATKQLTQFGTCESGVIGEQHYLRAEELLDVPDLLGWDLPLETPLRLQYVQAGAHASVPAVTPAGVAILSALLAGAGYLAIRFRSTNRAS